jgi:hypothetical protein
MSRQGSEARVRKISMFASREQFTHELYNVFQNNLEKILSGFSWCFWLLNPACKFKAG